MRTVALHLVAVAAAGLAGCSGDTKPSTANDACVPLLEVSALDLPAPPRGSPVVVNPGGALRISGRGFRATCGGVRPFGDLLSVSVVQGDRDLLVAQVTAAGRNATFATSAAMPPTMQFGPAQVEVRPAEGADPRSAHAVMQLVVGRSGD